MLPDTITLNVDEANNSVNVSTTWTRVDFFNTRSVYNAAGHSVVERDLLNFYRTAPTKSGNYNGVAKCALKITDDVSVPGVDTTTTVVAPLIGEVAFSVPVGSTAVQQKKLRQRIIALLDDEATMAKLFAGEV